MRLACVVGCAVVAACAVASSAHADIDLLAQNGDVIRASLGAPGEVGTYYFDCPSGVVIDATATPAKRGPALSLTLLDASGNQIGSAAAPDVVALHVTSPADAEYRLQVAAQDGVSTGDYVVSMSWMTPQPVSQRVTIGGQSNSSASFRGWRGDVATISIAPAAGSKAKPRMDSLTFFSDASFARPRATVVLPQTQDYVVEVGNSGDTGDVVVSIMLKSARRRLSFAGASIPSGVQMTAAAPATPRQSVSVHDDSPYGLAGSGISVPRGADRNRTSIWIGTAPVIDSGVPGWQAASPAMFVGPAGLKFRRNRPASVTLSAYRDGEYRVFARAADGTVFEVPPASIAPGDYANILTFPTDGSATYQAFTPIEPVQGVAVAATDDVVAVGTPGQGDGPYVNAGAVTVLARNGAAWTQEAVLTDDVPIDNDFFGNVVALSGDTLVVGGPGSRTTARRGRVLIYVRGADHDWTRQATLQTSDPTIMSDGFGSSVAIDGDTVVVGSPDERRPHAIEDSAYVFDRSVGSWTVAQRLTVSPSRTQYSDLGTYVALSEDSLLVGDDFSQPSVYTRDAATWSLQATLEIPLSPTLESFFPLSSSIALDGDTAVIGVRSYSDSIGEAFMFSRSGTTWTQSATLTPQDAGYGDSPYFGASVSLHAGRILVGAPGSGFGAFLYADDPGGPHVLSAVGSFDQASNRGLGAAVALTPSGTTAIVGADSTSRAFEYDVP